MYKYLIVVIGLGVFSCNIKRLDTSQMVKEMKNSEVKRITKEQISAFANDWGTEISGYLNKDKSHEKNIDSLQNLYHAKISKLDITTADKTKLDPKEAELLDAFKYNIDKNIPIPNNLQKLENGEIQLFTAPVLNEKSQIWRIEFSKKEIIRRVSVKDIKKNVTK